MKIVVSLCTDVRFALWLFNPYRRVKSFTDHKFIKVYKNYMSFKSIDERMNLFSYFWRIIYPTFKFLLLFEGFMLVLLYYFITPTMNFQQFCLLRWATSTHESLSVKIFFPLIIIRSLPYHIYNIVTEFVCI